MKPTYVYSEHYDFVVPSEFTEGATSNLLRFDGRRASRAFELFKRGAGGAPMECLQPEPATHAELLRAHDAAYLESLNTSDAIAAIMEAPAFAELPHELLASVLLAPMRLATGGTILAARTVFERGLVINLSGGYHHAKRAQGEGFCAYSDITAAIRAAQAERGPLRAIVVDLDAHQGNGVASICASDESIAIFDVYNGDIWPQDAEARAAIRWDFALPSSTRGAEYLALLERELPRALDEFAPDLMMYNAGTDIVAGDPLGLLDIAPADVTRRDEFVLKIAARRELPTVVTASGGYSEESHRLLAALLSGVREGWLDA